MKGYSITLGIIKRIFITIIALSLAFTLGIGAAGSYCVEAAELGAEPDLIVQNITLSPEYPLIGDTVTITVTVKNPGTEEAGSSRVACYIDDTYLTSEYIDPIGPSATAMKTFIWNAKAGSHTIRAVADYSEQVSEANESNNTKTFTFSTLAPDLIIRSISWTPEDPSRGDIVTFSVKIENQGTTKSHSSRVNFYIDGNSRGYQDVYSIDADDTVTKTYSWPATAGQHAIKAAVDEANNVEESDETNNEQTVTFTTLPPDLIVQDITWSPENPSKYDDVTFTVTITNQGTGRADSFHVAYYIDEFYSTSDYVGPMEAGTSTNMTFNWTALADSHDIKAIIDSYDKVIEGDETNNVNTVTFLTLAPDLIVQNITWSPADAAVGDTVTFTVTITNQGSGKAENSRTACYISGQNTGYLDIQEIDAGAEVTKTFDWTATAGSHAVKVVADYANRVIETNESNNQETVTIAIILSDLFVQDITWSPADASVGDTVTFTVTITNQGSGKAEHFRVAHYIDDDFLTSHYINQIEAGASANRTFTWKVQNGSHTVRAVADYSSVILENDENNNENTVIVSPIMPDLIIDNITWSPADLSAGSEVTFDVTIKNQGSKRAGSSRIVYYVDGSIVGYQDIGQMDVGATVTENFPWTAEAGPHVIKMAADSTNQVVESDETNNVRTVNLPPPDLIVQDITWSPADAAVGDTVTFTVNIKNQGSGKTENSHATYYIDDSSLGYEDMSAMDSGAVVTKTFTWIAEVGTHIIKIVADPNNLVTEIDETNNEKAIDFSTIAPDLTIQDISWLIENPLISDAVTFIITIKNQGSDKADSSKLTCYIDDSSASDQDLPTIDAGATVTKTFLLTVDEGSHTVDVVADSNNQVTEIDEANNEKSLDFSTIAPDLVIKDITWSPAGAAVGDTVTFTVKIKNQGSDKAINSRVDFYIDDSSVGYRDVEEIDAGDIVNQDFTWVAEAGPHDISMFVDLDEMILESNESNNTEHLSLSLPATGEAADVAGKLTSDLSRDTSILEDWWWLPLVAAVIFGGIGLIAAMKSRRT